MSHRAVLAIGVAGSALMLAGTALDMQWLYALGLIPGVWGAVAIWTLDP